MRVGIDIGGTFTDFVVHDPVSNEIKTFKLLSTPHDPADVVLSGLAMIREEAGENIRLNVVHGSTVATNALLERKGARTALISTTGFRDVLEIGRQNRPELYNLFTRPPQPLVPRNLRFEVSERVDNRGRTLVDLQENELEPLRAVLGEQKVESVAVSLLFSFLNPEHEKTIASRLREAGYLVSISSEILPEYREYERTSTTVVNAYVSPVLDRYLSRLETVLSHSSTRLQVMQSNGGQISIPEARRNGVRCILSGPAGGVMGALAVARLRDSNSNPEGIQILTFDMGGTSTDVSMVEGAPEVTSESIVGGCPIRIPVLDIHTIGAGGGSIASVDLGGALRVGPESAGADPGPACYGRGDPFSSPATVTDANVVLGRLDPDTFLGGKMQLDSSRALEALKRLSQQLNLDPIEAALGIIDVVEAHMERALRVISVERGRDPRQFTLLSFGGAGGLHAANLARRLEIPYVLVPPMASTLSAFGMLQSDIVKDYSQTVMITGEIPTHQIAALFEPLLTKAWETLLAEDTLPGDILLEPSIDVRYSGQSYELTVPWRNNSHLIGQDFHYAHKKAYGYSREDAPLEIVNLRLKAIGKVHPPEPVSQVISGSDPSSALLQTRQVITGQNQSGPVISDVPHYRFELLQPGNHISGPALIVREDTTVFVPANDKAVVDPYGNILISIHIDRS
ncbi:MAG: hydantoinase/oxoprolinase family protein [Chloroflexi bacterium]|nr:MAG: hydantoinase/oxoprolinase family protein [Chloroflexota bacterium]